MQMKLIIILLLSLQMSGFHSLQCNLERRCISLTGAVHATAKDVHTCLDTHNCYALLLQSQLNESQYSQLDLLRGASTAGNATTSSSPLLDGNAAYNQPTTAAGSGVDVCPQHTSRWDYIEFKGCFQYDEKQCHFPDICAIYFQYTVASLFLFSNFSRTNLKILYTRI